MIGDYEHESRPDIVLAIADASNLDRNLFLVTQVMDLEIPIVLVLNMMDVAEQKNISIDVESISKNLGLPVIPISAKKKEDIERLKSTLADMDTVPSKSLAWLESFQLRQALGTVKSEWIDQHTEIPESAKNTEALRLISEGSIDGVFYKFKEQKKGDEVIQKARAILENRGKTRWQLKFYSVMTISME